MLDIMVYGGMFLIKDSDDYMDYTVVINSLRVKTLMLTCLGHDIGVVRQT